MKNMGIVTNEFYIEYLELKKEIQELNVKIEAPKWFEKQGDSQEENKKTLDVKIERMKVVLEQLKLGGVTAETLLWLSLGVDEHSE